MRASLRSTVLAAVLTLSFTACSGSGTPPAETSAPATSAAAPASAPSVDAELEQVKSVTPVVACDLLTLDEVGAVFPGLKFQVKQQLAPRMSGYSWDSRCEYEAGVGTISYAKDTPTHSVQVFVNTVASDAKAQSNLKSRAELAAQATNYKPQPALGVSAYTIGSSGTASAFLVKGQAEIQLFVSDLKSSNDEKVATLLALAKGL